MYFFVAAYVIMSIFSSDRGLIQLTETEKQFQERIKEIVEERDLLMYTLIIIVFFIINNNSYKKQLQLIQSRIKEKQEINKKN